LQVCELSPYLKRKDTVIRKAITVPKRIAVALTVLKGNIDFWVLIFLALAKVLLVTSYTISVML